MTTWFSDLMEELEKKEEERRIELSKLECDRILQTIAVLDGRIQEVAEIASKELAIIDDWKQSQTAKIERQVSWLAGQLERFIRSTNQKSIVLPHGSLFLRVGRPKVSVVDSAAFLSIGERLGLVRIKPASKEPDLNSIHAYVRRVGSVPPGVAYTPATVGFSFKTMKGRNNGTEQREQTEAGSNGESDSAEAGS